MISEFVTAIITKEWKEMNPDTNEMESVGQESKTEKVGVSKPLVDPCTVGVNYRNTIGLPDFSSVTVGVLLSVPCDTKEIDAVFDFAKSWCEDRMNVLVEGLGLDEE